jgi:hypothetical protein
VDKEAAKKLVDADLSIFDDDALIATLALLALGLENKVDVPAIEIYAAYGKVSYELDERGH